MPATKTDVFFPNLCWHVCSFLLSLLVLSLTNLLDVGQNRLCLMETNKIYRSVYVQLQQALAEQTNSNWDENIDHESCTKGSSIHLCVALI